MTSVHDTARHEALQPLVWDPARALAAIRRVAGEAEAVFSGDGYWPVHPLDADGAGVQPLYDLYHGACGVIWALHHLAAAGAIPPHRPYAAHIEDLVSRTHAWFGPYAPTGAGSYLMGETSMRLLGCWLEPAPRTAERLEQLIAGNADNPARELMWGAPGTALAALFLFEHSGEDRWADLFRATAARLWSALEWSPRHGCHYWTQALYGRTSTYLGAVHGFAGNVLPIVKGRHLLADGAWTQWRERIAATVLGTATRAGPLANWPVALDAPRRAASPALMQVCHGAPGLIVCLADFPGAEIDDLLVAGGEAVWAAGPLTKGPNLCHGTAGNGYAFLKLYRRTGEALWLERARAFAMHAIAQAEIAAALYGRMRYSLWTGDLGLAIYLWNCVEGTASFPTLDVFFA